MKMQQKRKVKEPTSGLSILHLVVDNGMCAFQKDGRKTYISVAIKISMLQANRGMELAPPTILSS
jgi:hypothetical protein